jgi:hypothetical protein
MQAFTVKESSEFKCMCFLEEMPLLKLTFLDKSCQSYKFLLCGKGNQKTIEWCYRTLLRCLIGILHTMKVIVVKVAEGLIRS